MTLTTTYHYLLNVAVQLFESYQDAGTEHERAQIRVEFLKVECQLQAVENIFLKQS